MSGIGIVLIMLGMASMDSDKLWFPLTCLGLGMILLGIGAKREKNTTHIDRLDSRPKFLP